MDAWLEIVIRQFILYSIPVLISLTLVTLIESILSKQPIPHPLFAIGWTGTWLPWAAAILFTRGIIIALPQPLSTGSRAAACRLLAHLLLCGVGFLLYSWSLQHPPAAGLPPLHHWWAKVFMFFNLCMAGMHLVPLPGQWAGELLLNSEKIAQSQRDAINQHRASIHAIIATTPLLDLSVGGVVIFPIYERLANLAGM